MGGLENAYEEYAGMVRAFLTRLCGSRELAEELTQETFYQAARAWQDFRGQSGVSTWLCAIAKNLYYSNLRKKAPVPLDSQPERSEPDFTDRLIAQDRAMTAQKALHALSEPYREVFTLRTFCDMSHAQIGELFGKSEAWSRVTYYRARSALQDRMREEEKDD